MDLAFSPDGQLLASISADKTLKIWQIGADRVARQRAPKLVISVVQNKIHEPKYQFPAGYHVAFSPVENLVAASSCSTRNGLWPPDPTSAVKLWTAHGALEKVLSDQWKIADMDFSPDGRLLATSVATSARFPASEVKIWNVQTGEIQLKIPLENKEKHSTWISPVAFAPNGKYLVIEIGAPRGRGDLLFWDVVANKQLFELTGHIQRVVSLDFSPDGRFLASGGHDKTLRLWDLETKQEVWRMTHTAFSVQDVQFSRHGKYLGYHIHNEIHLIKMPNLLRKILSEQAETRDVSRSH